MHRRKFGKLVATATAGTYLHPGQAKTLVSSGKHIPFGGPVFIKYQSPEEWIAALQAVNYTAAYCPLESGAAPSEIAAYKMAAQKVGIIISEVGAWSNPIDPDEKKARAAIEKNSAALQLADEIGANCCVNISGSRNPEKWAGPHKDNLTPDTFDLIVENTRKIIDDVKPKNTFYTLETMPWAYPNSVDSYVNLVNAINRKAFAVHLDPVNLITGVNTYFKNGELIKQAFRKLGKYIRSCHAKDILLLDDKLTPHLPEVRAGLGALDYNVFLQELANLKNIPLMMEHLKSAEEYNKAADYIRSVAKKNNIQI